MKSSSDTKELLKAIIPLAKKAGEAILDIYTQKDFGTTYKEDDSPLTHADMASHTLIEDFLTSLTPDIPILSEESRAAPYAVRKSWKRFWMIDPLDGTKEFIKRNGEFTVNISLIDQHNPVLGVVYAPVVKTVYYGSPAGAYRQVAAGKIVEIEVSKNYNKKLTVVVSRSHKGEALDQFLLQVKQCECIPKGSSLKFCLVAEGTAHLYPRFGPTMEWDTAAAHCVVESAGGTVTDLQGKSLTYNKADLLNPFFMVSGVPSFRWEKYLS